MNYILMSKYILIIQDKNFASKFWLKELQYLKVCKRRKRFKRFYDKTSRNEAK